MTYILIDGIIVSTAEKSIISMTLKNPGRANSWVLAIYVSFYIFLLLEV